MTANISEQKTTKGIRLLFSSLVIIRSSVLLYYGHDDHEEPCRPKNLKTLNEQSAETRYKNLESNKREQEHEHKHEHEHKR
jgi:hypothetical protein